MTNNNSNRSKIRLGWHLHPKNVSVDLAISNDLAQHTAILAQSGSGKSFLLSRFLEELLLATGSKIVIFDTNGDFRYFHEVDDTPWNTPEIRKWFGKKTGLLRDASKKHFLPLWKKLEFARVNNYDRANNSLLFSSLSKSYRFRLLGIADSEFPEGMKPLLKVMDELDSNGKGYSLSTLMKECAKEVKGDAGTPLFQFVHNLTIRQEQKLEPLQIWAENSPDILDLIDYSKKDWRAFIHDLPSIANNEARMIIVNACLEKLWEVALKQWERSLSDPDKDNRKPLFIVLDEAHNFLSTSKDDPWWLC